MPSSLSALGAVPYSPNNSSLSQLLMQQGNQRANAALRSGDIWGNAIQGIGQQIAGGIQDYAHTRELRKREDQQRQLMEMQNSTIDEAFATGKPDPAKILKVFGPKGMDILKGFESLNPQTPYEDQMGRVRDAARGIMALPPDKQPAAYAAARQSLITQGHVDPSVIPEQFSPDVLTQGASYGMQPIAPKAPDLKQVTVRNADGSETIKFVNPEQGMEFNSAAPQKAPAAPKEAKMDWVLRDGKPAYVPVSEIRGGDRPYSESAMSGRSSEETKPLGADAAGKLAYATTAIKLGKDLAKEISNPAIYAAGYGASKTGIGATGLDRKVDDLIDAALRSRTGAAATADEKADKKAQIYRAWDVFRGDTSGAVDAINRIVNEMMTTKIAIDPNNEYSNLADKARADATPVRKKFNPATGMVE